MNPLPMIVVLILSGPLLSVGAEETFTYKSCEPIVLQAELQVPEGMDVQFIKWRVRSADIHTRSFEGGTSCCVWALPGKYEVFLDAYMVDWEAHKSDYVEKVFNLHVEGARPPPVDDDPDDPDDPPDVETSGDILSVVIRVPEKLTGSQVTAMASIRDWSDEDGNLKRVTHFAFPPDAELIDGSINAFVKSYVDKIPTGAFYPYGFLLQNDAGGKAVIKWQGTIASDDDYINRARELLK